MENGLLGGEYEKGIPIMNFFFFDSNQNNGLDQDGEKGMDSGYVLEVHSTGLADGLDKESEGKRNWETEIQFTLYE